MPGTTMAAVKPLTGSDIGQLRRVLGMSQPLMADLFGVSKRTIGNWEAGRTSPSPLLMAVLVQIRRRLANAPSVDAFRRELYGVFPDVLLDPVPVSLLEYLFGTARSHRE